ncbi:MAG: hypothetical protein AB8F95_07590 [Bacteroidia bacterium]
MSIIRTKNRISRWWILLSAIAIAAFIFQLNQQNWLLADSKEYIAASENLFQHGSLYSGDLEAPFRTDYLTKRPPLYPIILGVLVSFPFLLFVQYLLFLFNLVLSWRILRLLTVSQNSAFFILTALSFSVFIYPGLVMTEVWLQSLLIGAAYGLVLFWLKEKSRGIWITALCIALSLWLKPVTYPLALGMIIFLPFLSWVKKRSIPKAVITALIPLVSALCLGGINYARTSSFHFSSITSINLLQYNAYYTKVRIDGEAEAERWVDAVAAQANTIQDYPSRQQFIQQKAAAVLKENPGTYASLHAKGMIHFFADPGRFDLYHFFNWDRATGKNTGLLAIFSSEGYGGIWSYMKAQGFWPLFMLGLSFLGKIGLMIGIASALFRHRRNWPIMLLLLAIPFYLALATGPLGASRFAVPVIPLLVVCASLGFNRNVSLSFST